MENWHLQEKEKKEAQRGLEKCRTTF